MSPLCGGLSQIPTDSLSLLMAGQYWGGGGITLIVTEAILQLQLRPKSSSCGTPCGWALLTVTNRAYWPSQ